MQNQLYLKYTYGNHNYKEWLLYWGTHGGDECSFAHRRKHWQKQSTNSTK